MQAPDIRYEDDHLIVACKPAGMLSEDSGDNSLPALLRAHTGGTIYPVHRLDRTTGGLIVYAKTPDTASALSRLIRAHQIEKIYLAAVEGTPDPRGGEMRDLLYYDRTKGKAYPVSRPRKGVKEASLSYETLDTVMYEGTELSLVRVRLYTGRTHQIRVQFASRKTPLVGDRRYGSRTKIDRLALCAVELSFVHPITEKKINIQITPDGDPFNRFGISYKA